MRIGVTSIFSFRPHVEHLAYLARLLSAAGHEVHGLTCDAALSHCYSRQLRQKSKLRECPRCVLGGIRTFPIERVSSLDPGLRTPLDPSRLSRLVISSVAVRFRTEPVDVFETNEFREAIHELGRPVETAYANAMRWIERNRLEGVLLFNGRMDVLAGVAAACEDMQVPYVSIERPWLAHGIAMFPNANCLDLRALDKMCVDFSEKPLRPEQAEHAGAIAAEHSAGQNPLLWRVYNAEAQRSAWPLRGAGEQVLILPSSRNEFEGHPDWLCAWGDYTAALDHMLDHLGIDGRQCVLRCHPNWAEKIGPFTGWRSEQHYTAWCKRRGIHVIPSASRVSTYDLMAAADTVVVNGSSTGPEAALRGKQVILVGHATYQRAGFCSSIATPREMDLFVRPSNHSPEATVVKALRFMYLSASRFPQFVSFVRATSNTRCEYLAGAEAERVTRLMLTGDVQPDDELVGHDGKYERDVAAALLSGEFSGLRRASASHIAVPRMEVRRRLGLRWIDELRDRMPRGDV